MSTLSSAIVNPGSEHGSNEALGQGQPAQSAQNKNYKGFVAGIFSGVSKLSGKTPPYSHFKTCLVKNTV